MVDVSEPLGTQWNRLDHDGRRRWLARQFDESGLMITVTREGYVAGLSMDSPAVSPPAAKQP